MTFHKPVLIATAIALAATAGCALPAMAAPASHAAATTTSTDRTAARIRPAHAVHSAVHHGTAAATHHVALKTTSGTTKHTVEKKAHPAKKTHVVRTVVETTSVTVHGVPGQVTLTKSRGTGHFALTVAGFSWTGIDLGTNRNQAVFSWLHTHPSFDTVGALTAALEARFPGVKAQLPADLVLASLAL